MAAGARFRVMVGVVAMLALAAAGCGTSNSKAASTSTSTTVANAALVATRQTAVGTVLAGGGNGMTLYVFDNETNGTIACTGACANTWHPLSVAGGAPLPTIPGVVGFTIVTRPDGTHQLAAASRPLYFYSGDAAPGDTKGDGVGGVWHTARVTILGATTGPTVTATAGGATTASSSSATTLHTTTTRPTTTSTRATTSTTHASTSSTSTYGGM